MHRFLTATVLIVGVLLCSAISPLAQEQASFATNLDLVAGGDLFFEAPDRRWSPGIYRLVVDHEHAQAALPIKLD